ncbi:phosphatase PAP2 family protein [Frisingicoccus sp.]|uniref:phosphatase PAP2 family protein n=1 Tax=Frisingicoccus sp. TaxID=1918627 RepID=UPI003735E985
MNKEAYESLISWAHEKPVRENMLCGLTKVLPIVLGGMYIIAILLCAVVYPVLLVRLILRPFFCFLTVTVMRRILSRERPYDVYGFVPLSGYHPGKKNSFPSRHTASAAIIALELFHLWPVVGSMTLFLAACMGTLRIVCGNHFIKDVIGGFVIAFIFYIL